MLAEIPRALQRIAAADPKFSLRPALRRAGELIEALALYPVDAFVTYDERQAAAARLAGLKAIAPAN